MGISCFQQHVHVKICGKKHILLRKVSEDLWQLEEVKTKRIIEHTDEQLRSIYANGQLIFYTERLPTVRSDDSDLGVVHREITDEQFEKAKNRRVYALAVWDLPNTGLAMRPKILAIWEKLKSPIKPPHWTTVFRWKARFQNAGKDIHSLVDEDGKRGNRTPRYQKDVLDIVTNAIDIVYLTRERKTIQDTLDKARYEVRRENKLLPAAMQLQEPTRRFITSVIEAIPAFDRCVARYGQIAAVKRFRAVLAHRTTDAPLDRAEMDHTLLDLLVIDDETGLPLGRPWITACIDDNTRCLLGINIGFEPPSYLSVARCLKHAFLPKVTLRQQYPSIQNNWDAYGAMRELVVDNGNEFHSKSLENACYSLGIEIHYSARKTPWFKGKIERFLGTLNAGIADGNPGSTFGNIFDKDDYDPAKHAVIRLSKLREIAHIWIVDYYHQKPHRSLKLPPAVLWKTRISAEDIPVPDDPARLDAILGRSEQRKLTHKGIELDGLLYNSPELTRLRQKLGEKLDVEIRVDDIDIGEIVVLSPDKKRMFKVPAIAVDYAKGLTRWQHRVCKRYAAREMEKYDAGGWLNAKETISRLIREEFMHKKMKSRAKIARFQGEGTKPSETTTTSKPSSHAPQTVPEADASSKAPTSPVKSEAKPATSLPKTFKPIIRVRNQHVIETDQQEKNNCE